MSNSKASRRAVAVTMALGLSACSMYNPHRFHEKLDRYDTQTAGSANANANANTDAEKLGGNLHLAMQALEGQRRDYWNAVGTQTKVKNGLATTLIPLASWALYKTTGDSGALKGEAVRKAALFAASGYSGYTWLAGTNREDLYLNGAAALTCMAADFAPLAVAAEEFKTVTFAIEKAEEAHQKLYTAHKQLSKLPSSIQRQPEVGSMIAAAQSKLKFSRRVLNDAARATAAVQQSGEALRSNTLKIAQEVAHTIDRSSPELSSLKNLIAGLPSLSNELLALEVFAQEEDESPSGPPAANGEAEAKGGGNQSKCAASTPSTGSATADPAAKSASQAKDSANAAEKSAKAAARSSASAAQSASSARAAAAAAVAGAASASEPTADRTDTYVSNALKRAQAKLEAINKHLPVVMSWVSRMRNNKTLYRRSDVCGGNTQPEVTILPDISSVTPSPMRFTASRWSTRLGALAPALWATFRTGASCGSTSLPSWQKPAFSCAPAPTSEPTPERNCKSPTAKAERSKWWTFNSASRNVPKSFLE